MNDNKKERPWLHRVLEDLLGGGVPPDVSLGDHPGRHGGGHGLASAAHDVHVLGVHQVHDVHVLGVHQVHDVHVLGVHQVHALHVLLGVHQVYDIHVLGVYQVIMYMSWEYIRYMMYMSCGYIRYLMPCPVSTSGTLCTCPGGYIRYMTYIS